ncbi:FadR/GntR family transcriptional regulator [Tranquillimonas alkanivorans]|uniref:Transcriptional regulator, GntR family n=1 Tax=Tranquillimonas alkanivorans TaxID=441119 RepID=A0A1I5RBG9_9RHOB|nr:GntR family transcriptional regulator [Tranquillimonas alkanivorans]SFP55884.1 transcriptional regulator, GntR family [Tranquillimonas alkanivorans]
MAISDTGDERDAVDLPTGIAEEVRDRIMAGALSPGDRLPSEARMAISHGVSRATVREALKQLAAQGILDIRRGSRGGPFVRAPCFVQAARAQASASALLYAAHRVDACQALAARHRLVAACLPLAVRRAEARDLDQLEAGISLQKRAHLPDGAFHDSATRFLRNVVDATGDRLLSSQLAGVLEGLGRLLRNCPLSPRPRVRLIVLHQEMAAALAARDLARLHEDLEVLAEVYADVVQLVRADKSDTSSSVSLRTIQS